MNTKKFSFIIPAHNAERTLMRCVDSILSETVCFAEYGLEREILIVENGSTDGTYALAKDMAEVDPAVRVCVSETGVSLARNAGLEQAEGDYIVFADADDYLCEGAGELLVQCVNLETPESAAIPEDLEESSPAELTEASLADLEIFSYEKGKGSFEFADAVYKGDEALLARCEMLSNPTTHMSCWGKVYRGDIIRLQGLLFNEELDISEDSEFLLRYTSYCKTIRTHRGKLYHYNMEEGTAIRSFDGRKEGQILSAMKVAMQDMEQEMELYRQRNKEQELRQAFDRYILMHFHLLMVHEIFVSPEIYVKQKADMKRLAKAEPFSSRIRGLKLSQCVSARMLPFLLIKCKCYNLAAWAYIVRVAQNARRAG